MNEEAVDKFDDGGVKASMGSYLSLMVKAMEAQHSRFLLEHEVDQSEGSETENEEPKSAMGGGNGREKDSVLVDKENEANNDVSERPRLGVLTQSQAKFNWYPDCKHLVLFVCFVNA